MAAKPTVFLLHALGGSARSWAGVVAALGDGFDCVPLDLPGFGDDAASPRFTVQETLEQVAEQVRRRQPDRWLVVGHSMGGKIAQLLIAAAEAGDLGLIAPAGAVLVAPSTLVPEPMAEDRRELMRSWWADGTISEADATAYVEANLVGPPDPAVLATAVADVRRTSREAWLAWLDRGSLEDRDPDAGVLRTPVTVVVGEADQDLGEENQRRLTLPRFTSSELVVVAGAAHDVPHERPERVAAAIADRWAATGDPELPPAFARLIASDRVSARTRRALLNRIPERTDGPVAFDDGQRDLLRAVLARVLPQRGTDLDLARRIEVELASGRGDGWRFAELPPDAEAWRLGADSIAAIAPDFTALDAAAQDAVLDRIEAGDAPDGPLTAPQLVLWVQDVRAEAVRVFLSHPAAQAWIRFDGFADGGDGPRKQGFQTTHAGEWEPWQRDWRTGEELQA